MIINNVIDARGHKCPVPSLRLQTFWRNNRDWVTVELWADDPMARIDLPFLCQTAGNVEIEVIDQDQTIIFKIKRKTKESLY